jgi:hypothetical protein
MSAALVLAIVISIALVVMLATFMIAARFNRRTGSLESAEREGRLGPEGLRHARQRRSAAWVEQERPFTTLPISDVVNGTIADAHGREP